MVDANMDPPADDATGHAATPQRPRRRRRTAAAWGARQRLLGAATLALCLLGSGCGGAARPFPEPLANSVTRVCFPAPVTTRRAHEGPFATAFIAHANADGARFELARFDLPKALSRAERRVLMQRVERGLRARPDLEHAEQGTIVVAGTVTRVLTMRLDEGRFGKWLLSFPSASQMLQISVVGPRSARAAAEGFFATIGSARCGATPE